MSTILLVEDDEALSRLLSRYLNQRGYTVLQAGNGPAALAIAARHTADIALIDQLLPELPGRVVIQRLRADARWQHTPIVAMSGLGQPYLDAAVGASATLAKPFPLSTLDTLLARLAGKTHPEEHSL